ncbi:hypothetical protein [Streptomyces sp. NPDC005953]|uniref:hypothetical protein n=1 Tax=Streptomyces sp. NPDC005953 TaxID=3156719 RepID=UPI00340C012E
MADLLFAELADRTVAGRVFDVVAEAPPSSPYRISISPGGSGVRMAHDPAFTVRVTEGQLNLRCVASVGRALVNSIRVTERPDLTG